MLTDYQNSWMYKNTFRVLSDQQLWNYFIIKTWCWWCSCFLSPQCYSLDDPGSGTSGLRSVSLIINKEKHNFCFHQLIRTHCSSQIRLFHFTVLALLGLLWRTISITIVPPQHERGRHSNAALTNGGHGGDGVLAAVCVFLSHTKQREERQNHCNAVVGV